MDLVTHAGPIPNLDWLIVPCWQDTPAPAPSSLHPSLGPTIASIMELGDFAAKPGEAVPVYGTDPAVARRVLLLGLGQPSEAERGLLIRAAATAAKAVMSRPSDRVAMLTPTLASAVPWLDTIRALACGLRQMLHHPGLAKAEPSRFVPKHLSLVAPPPCPADEARRGFNLGVSDGRAVALARELVNEPPNALTPQVFAERCRELAKDHGLTCEILDEQQIAAERMGCLLAVARGSEQPPRVVVLSYHGAAAPRRLGLVGKGVTFDSGGLSLKTTEQMLDMKCDMAGAAAVVAAMTAMAERKLPVQVVGVLALVENMPGGRAFRLGDVLRARNGKTVEIHNTDAEGRLILADALDYVLSRGATHVVDVATLTGACMVALGTEVAGLFANQASWAEEVHQAIRLAGEKAWTMPMFPEYHDLLKSQVADLKNVGGKYAGAITAAKFLEQFVGTTPWAHLDIAGPSFAAEENASRDAGGTGCFVRSLVRLAEHWSQ